MRFFRHVGEPVPPGCGAGGGQLDAGRLASWGKHRLLRMVSGQDRPSPHGKAAGARSGLRSDHLRAEESRLSW